MAVNMIFNPVIALILFTLGIWMGSMIDPMYGLITILGGLLLGFSNSFKSCEGLNKKSKFFLYVSFVFLLSLMSLTYIAISIFLL